MKKIKTYIVNLKDAPERKQYMIKLLSPYEFLDVEFVEAFDGRKITEEERNQVFDDQMCQKLVGRKASGGEIGCTISHRLCFKKLLSTSEKFALILEDDISIVNDIKIILDNENIKCLYKDLPTVLLLSGDYWYWKKDKVVNVFDCVGTYAYFINRPGAKLMLSHKACTIADQWWYYRDLGLIIKAMNPYIIDANLNMNELSSCVDQYSWGIERKNMKLEYVIKGYIYGAIKKTLKATGHFEKKIRVWNNIAEIKK